jgi:PAS domain S-box-containing protein
LTPWRCRQGGLQTISDSPFFARRSAGATDLAEALKESHELLVLAEQSAGIGVWDNDLATDMVRGTPTFFRLMGLPVANEAIANDVVRAVRHPDDAGRVRQGYLDAVARGLDTYEVEYRIIRPSDGEQRWIFGRGRTVRDSQGRPVRYSGVDIDITERKQAEEHVRLLMNELNHRANNLLAVVQAIARQTADSTDAKAYALRLSQRIAGLAASNSLLVSGKWQGVELATLVRSQLAPFVADLDARVVLDGPSLRLMSAAAQAVGMALHELATNAVKHGALSSSTGMLRIDWSVAEQRSAQASFHMSWTEQGGPPVGAPQRTGFGRTVMERMIAQALGGTAVLDFAPTGLVWRFTCPADRALEGANRG